MKRALTFLAITGLSLASKSHHRPSDAIIIKPLSSDNRPVQVPYGAMDDDEFRVVSHPRYSNEAIIIKPFDNKPVQVPYGAMDDDEFRILSHPENTHKPLLINRPVQVPYGALDDDEFRLVSDPKFPKPVYSENKPVQVPYGAMDDDNEFYTQSKKTRNPVLGGKPVETPYLQNQKKFQHIQFPQPVAIEGKPVEVPYGALDDELYSKKSQKTKEPVLGGKPSLRPYLDNQKKFEHVQFPQPVPIEGRPIEVPYGALGI